MGGTTICPVPLIVSPAIASGATSVMFALAVDATVEPMRSLASTVTLVVADDGTVAMSDCGNDAPVTLSVARPLAQLAAPPGAASQMR